MVAEEFNSNWLSQCQQDDPETGVVWARVSQGLGCPTKQELQGMGDMTRKLFVGMEQLSIQGGLLKIGMDNKDKVVLPASGCATVIRRLHEGFEGAHLGVDKTF